MAPQAKRRKLSNDAAELSEISVATAADGTPRDSARKPDDSKKRTIFVRSLAPETTTDDLTEHFSQAYPLKHAVAVLDPATKQCKGFGFVTFTDAEDTQNALNELQGSSLRGRKIRVELAESRQRDGEGPDATAKKERLQREKEPPPQTKLIIRNLPFTITEPDELARIFTSFGKIKFVDLPKRSNGKHRGYGFVTIRGRKNAEKALEKVNGKEIDGRTLAVDWAVNQDTWRQLQADESEIAKEEAHDDEGMKTEDESEDLFDESIHDAESGDMLSADDDEDDEDDDEDDEDLDIKDEVQPSTKTSKIQPRTQTATLFVRNLSYDTTDASLHERFADFGPLRYARVVMDNATGHSRGTAFVCFVNEQDADACLRSAPQRRAAEQSTSGPPGSSVLQNEHVDPSGHHTLDGRVLHISRAVDRSEAARLASENASTRTSRDKDKRRLYLLSEGTIPASSPLFESLSPSEVKMREASLKQRKQMIESNPVLHLSLTRLAVRNIPRSVTSKDLKALARRAIVGFAEDMKGGKRQPLSAEELSRGEEEMKEAELRRKTKGKGVVKQAKVVFETYEGTKVDEQAGGRSRGYGFIEYYTHRSALMGLRWLNGHAIDYKVHDNAKPPSLEDMQDRKKRLIVEFAIENLQVVNRRKEREGKFGGQPKPNSKPAAKDLKKTGHNKKHARSAMTLKRKRTDEGENKQAQGASKNRKFAQRRSSKKIKAAKGRT